MADYQGLSAESRTETGPGRRDFRRSPLFPVDPVARFWSRVDRRAPNECWWWLAGVVTGGYGRFHVDGQPVAAHRFSYELARGPIPEGLHLDHLCRNRRCVNPAHLEAVTCRENVLRGIGPSAINAGKSTCPRGHLLSGDNVAMVCGRRECRACRTEKHRASYPLTAESRARAPRRPRKPPQKWARCHQGHELTADNRQAGTGRCLACKRAAYRARCSKQQAVAS